MATIVGPYTQLLLQTLAIVAGGVVLATVARTISRAAAVPTAAAVFLGVIAVNQVWGASGSFDSVRGRLAGTPGVPEREQCMIEGNHPDLIPFSRWIAARVPEDAELAYVARSFDRPCFQYALLPRRMVSDVERARYVMYLDPPEEEDRERLKDERRKPTDERTIEFYSPQWALERKD
jgi:hypothetical protein